MTLTTIHHWSSCSLIHFYEEYIEPIQTNEIYNYINNKTFVDEYGLISVTFKDGNGTLVFSDYGGNVVAIFTFKYEYNPTYQNIVIYDTESNNPGYDLVESDYIFDFYNQRLEFKIHNNIYDYDDKYTTSIR